MIQKRPFPLDTRPNPPTLATGSLGCRSHALQVVWTSGETPTAQKGFCTALANLQRRKTMCKMHVRGYKQHRL